MPRAMKFPLLQRPQFCLQLLQWMLLLLLQLMLRWLLLELQLLGALLQLRAPLQKAEHCGLALPGFALDSECGELQAHQQHAAAC